MPETPPPPLKAHAKVPALSEGARLDGAAREMGDVWGQRQPPTSAAYGLALASAAIDLLLKRRKA